MPTGLHHRTAHRHQLAVSRFARPLLLLLPLAALLLFASVSRAGTAGALSVERVQAATGSDGVQLDVTTTSSTPPTFALFSLRQPDRLVMDLPDFAWKPGLTAHLPSAHPAVQEVRIGQFSTDPLVTRVVFELTAPARPLCYRIVSSTADGNLRMELAADQEVTNAGDQWLALPAPATAKSGTAKGSTVGQAAKQSSASTRPAAKPRADAPELAVSQPAESPGMAIGNPAPQLQSTQPSPAPVPARVTAQLEEPALSGTAPRLAGAAALLVVTAVLAVWARRRFQGVSERPRASGDTSPAAPLTGSAPPADSPDLLRCRVVDGYLVLASEGKTDEASGSRRVSIRQGTLELDFSAVPDAEPLSGKAPAEPAPDVAARVADLIASLADDSVPVRRAAAEGLLELAAEGQAAALLPYLNGPEPGVRCLVVGVLGEAMAVEYLPHVARISGDPDPSVRACVMYALARFGESAAGEVGRVRACLSDVDNSVRAGAIEALAALFPRSEEVAEQILALTADAEPAVRQAAASTVLGFALRGVAGPLIALLADFTRRAQALELLQQADDAVLWRLLGAARSSDDQRAQAALDTLSYVMSRRWTVADFRDELESSDPEARLIGLEGISMIGGPEAIELVRRLAETDASPAVRKRAAEVLAKWDTWIGDGTAARGPAGEVRA